MIVYAIFATVSWFIIERAGRRKLFLWGTVGQMLSMALTFACLIPGTRTAARGAAVGLFTYIASFGATWLPLPWLYPAEVNPIKTRAKANAVSTCTNWLFNFLIVMVTPIMVANIGWGDLPLLRGRQCHFPALHLLLLSRDGQPVARGDRHHLCQGPRREHFIRQSRERAALPVARGG